jgi:hypothetical protein
MGLGSLGRHPRGIGEHHGSPRFSTVRTQDLDMSVAMKYGESRQKGEERMESLVVRVLAFVMGGTGGVAQQISGRVHRAVASHAVWTKLWHMDQPHSLYSCWYSCDDNESPYDIDHTASTAMVATMMSAKLSQGKRCHYFWQLTRYFPRGRTKGSN